MLRKQAEAERGTVRNGSGSYDSQWRVHANSADWLETAATHLESAALDREAMEAAEKWLLRWTRQLSIGPCPTWEEARMIADALRARLEEKAS